ncbi:hypothetical protein JCM5350_001996 [Sporobolomyces pararoseus]
MSSSFRPQYDQPVTLRELSTLEPELLVNGRLTSEQWCDGFKEISRLENSIKHLKRSNEELQDFLHDEEDEETKAEFVNTVFENQETIARQEERIRMIRIALEDQIGVQATNSHYTNAGSTTRSNLNSSSTQSTSTTTRSSTAEEEEEEVTGMASAVRSTQREAERITGNDEAVETNGRTAQEDGVYL